MTKDKDTVICGGCGFQNPATMKFCGECGNPLNRVCSQCHFENPGSFKFCGECGASLAGDTAPSPAKIVDAPATGRPVPQAVSELKEPAPDAAGDDAAERRQLTVMFCDLAESAALSDSLDPEEFRVLMRRYQEVCTRVIESYGGHVAQYLGDGLLVYFGYPTAHEDDARRAVCSGLGCVAAIDRLSSELILQGIDRLAIRVGVHTGLVVTGEIGAGSRRERLALGRTPNIAARLQNLAETGQVVISSDTHGLTKGFFDVEPLGSRRLQGISEPLEVFRVDRESDARSRFEVALRHGHLTPLIGRANEVGQLSKLWGMVTSGQGQVVLLRGEAGVGKSRLLQAFREHLGFHDHHYLAVQGTAYAEASALRPIMDMLESSFGFERGDTLTERFEKLELNLRKHGLDLESNVPLFALLLDLPLADDYQDLNLTPERRRRRTLEAIFELVQSLSAEEPLLFVVEDLHWLDPSTREFLDLLVSQGPTQRILVFFTCRPAFSAPWSTRSHLTQLNLTHLDEAEVRAMIERVTEGKSLPQVIVDEIATKTDGVPLFVEELTRMVIDSGLLRDTGERYELVSELRPLAIPSTLQESLTARLDSLKSAKEVAQLAAITGREFSFALLQSVADLDRDTLQDGLNTLVEAEMLYQRGVGQHAQYIFKHALIQNAAAFSMLKTKRQQMHRRIAAVLERDYPEIARATPERVAQHYSAAGDAEAAVDWWQRAGERALQQSANIEAIRHLEQGLGLLAELPESEANWQRELQMQTALGPAYCATEGYAAPEVQRAFGRAQELCRKVGDTSSLFPVLWGFWAFYVVRAELRTALDTAEEMMRIAEAIQDASLKLEACMALGLTRYFLGEPIAALAYMEVANELDSPERDRSFTSHSGQDAGVCNLAYAGLTLWMLGRPKEALARSREAVGLARKLKHPFSLAYALNFAAWLRYMLRDPEGAIALTDEEIAISDELGFFWVSLGSVINGWAQSERGDPKQGLERVRQGLQHYRAPGARLSQTLQLAIEAETCLRADDVDTGLQRIDEALAAVQETGERFWEAELHRIKGELLQAHHDHAAEFSLRTALDIARKQRARGLELRAAISLAGLLQNRQCFQEAEALLWEARTAFPGPPDTPDLRDADALLYSLRASLVIPNKLAG